MPELTVRCPSCSILVKIPATAAGRVCKCKCGKLFRTAARPEGKQPPAPASPKPAPEPVYETKPSRADMSPLWVLVGGMLLMGAVGAALYAAGLLPVRTAPSGGDTSAPRPSEARQLIQGEWESLHPEDRGIVEFRKDGSVRVAMAGEPELSGSYRFLAADILEVTLTPPEGPPRVRVLTVWVGPDELRTEQAGQVDVFRRVAGTSQ